MTFKLTNKEKQTALKLNIPFAFQENDIFKRNQQIKRTRRQYRKHGMDDSITWNLDWESFNYLAVLTNNKAIQALMDNPCGMADLYHSISSCSFDNIEKYQKLMIDCQIAISSVWGQMIHNEINRFLSFLNLGLKWYKNIDLVDMTFHECVVKDVPGLTEQPMTQAFWCDWLIERTQIALNNQSSEDTYKVFKVWSQVFRLFWN